MIENCSGFFLIDTFRDDVNSPEKRFLCLFHSRQTSHAPSFARGLDPNITSLAFIERQVEREKKKKKCVKGFSLYCTRIGVFESSKGRPSSATYARALPPLFFFTPAVDDGEEPVGRTPDSRKAIMLLPW